MLKLNFDEMMMKMILMMSNLN